MDDREKQGKEASHLDRLNELIKDMTEDEQQSLLKELEGRQDTKREHSRKSFLTVVDYAIQDAAYKDFIQNISIGGVFIQTSTPFAIGQEVSLTFPLSHSQKHLKIVGEVVRNSEQGIGVKFKVTSQDQEDTIKTLLETL